MTIRKKIFRTLIITNAIILTLTVAIGIFSTFDRTIKYESEKLNMLSRGFESFLGDAIDGISNSLEVIKDSNDIQFLFQNDTYLKGLSEASIKNSLKDVMLNYKEIESIEVTSGSSNVLSQGNSVIFQAHQGKVYTQGNDSYLMMRIDVNAEASLDVTISLDKLFKNFIEQNNFDMYSQLLFYEGNDLYYVDLQGNSAKMAGNNTRELLLSKEGNVDGLSFYVAKPKSYIFGDISEYIFLTAMFFLLVIFLTNLVSRYLAKEISSSITKVAKVLSELPEEHFEKIDVEDDFEDEIKTFVRTFNSVSDELNYNTKNMERIISEKTRKIEQQNEQLKHMSITDELTGLSNRRSFDEQFSKDFSLAYREKLYFNFAIVDIDHFKLVNDKYGHQIGDKCLQLLAYAFKKAFNRSSDKIFRYGGEEFIIYSLSKEKEKFYDILELLRDSVEKASMEVNGVSVKVTISIGAISLIPPFNEYERYIKLADDNLYKAKALGRNKVIIA
ncbi:MAG: diguanylate cyclase [Fervidobacterium sp.]